MSPERGRGRRGTYASTRTIAHAVAWMNACRKQIPFAIQFSRPMLLPLKWDLVTGTFGIFTDKLNLLPRCWFAVSWMCPRREHALPLFIGSQTEFRDFLRFGHFPLSAGTSGCTVRMMKEKVSDRELLVLILFSRYVFEQNCIGVKSDRSICSKLGKLNFIA